MNAATKTLFKASFWNSNPDAKIIRSMIKMGADVTARHEYGWTPLHAAAVGTPEAINALIAAGANIEATDVLGLTPLHFSAVWGTAEAVKAMIAAGANIEAKTKEGYTPADLAQDNYKLHDSKVLKLLAA